MIGIRPVLTAAGITAVLVTGLGAGGPRPEVELGARRLVLDRAQRADAALAQLEQSLATATDAARSGAARVVAGDEAPGGRLIEAASLIAAAETSAGEARRAVLALDDARRARSLDAQPIEPATERGELGSIATQLEATASAADDFAEMRARAAAVAGALESALVALEAGDTAAARALVAEARADHDAVAAWEVDFATLPVWTEITDEMIGAVERIVEAYQRGDGEAAVAAAGDFAALADAGATADRALRIAIGEGGSAVTAAPMERLASVLSRIEEVRRSLRSIIEAASA